MAASLGAGGLLAACGSSGAKTSTSATAGSGSTGSGATPALTDMSIQLCWVEDTEFAPLFLADSNGHYASSGVKMKFIPGGANVASIEGIVAGGAADIGISTNIYTTVSAVASGNPLVIIGAIYQKNLNTFMSTPAKPIKTPADLVGKRLGGSQGSQVSFDAIFKISGLPKGGYTFVPTGYGPSPLINGDCDAQAVFITDEALSYQATTGHAPVLLDWDDIGLPSYTLAIFTTKDFLASHRDAVKGFLKATQQGCDEDKADPTAGATLSANKYGKSAGITVSQEIRTNDAYVPLMSSAGTTAHGWLWVDPTELGGPIYKGMEAAGLKTAPVGQVLDTSLLTEIAQGK
jgi:ABC-type nitrate/sulfonate/bicarbonate transport system substrate-binding protein